MAVMEESKSGGEAAGGGSATAVVSDRVKLKKWNAVALWNFGGDGTAQGHAT